MNMHIIYCHSVIISVLDMLYMKPVANNIHTLSKEKREHMEPEHIPSGKWHISQERSIY